MNAIACCLISRGYWVVKKSRRQRSIDTAAHMTAVAASADAQAERAASLANAKFFSTEAASNTMCSSRGYARSSDTTNGSKPEHM